MIYYQINENLIKPSIILFNLHFMYQIAAKTYLGIALDESIKEMKL